MASEDKIILTLEADDNASQKIKNVVKSLREVDKASNNVGKDSSSGVSKIVNNLEKGISKVNKVTRQYNYSMSSLNRHVIRAVKDMGSAIYDFTSDSIKNFTEFSEQHAKTLGAMKADYDNTAESQRKFFEDAQKLKDQAIQIGTYGVNGNGSLMNVQQVSEAQTELVKAGVSAKEIADPNSNITKDVLEFAQANDLTTESAVEFAVTLGNQFGVDKKDWGSMLDKVSHTADMSIIDVKDIVQSMKYAGGITSGLDRSLEETLGMISILGDFGLKGSQGGSGIQALLTRLLTGDTTVITEAQAEVAPGNALDKFYEFEKKAKPDGNLLPMADVIDELDAAMSEMTDEEQAWFAKKLFGLYQMKSAYALLNGDETDLNDIIKEITEQSDGTNQNKLDELLNSQYGQLTSLNNLWEGIKTDVGDRLSPFVDAVRDELFNFLSNDGNYDINFDNLRSALDESCDLIEEKYGSAIANAVRNIGDFTIDLAQVAEQIGPELGNGLSNMLSSLFEGDFFGKGGVFDDWGTMIDNMYESVNGLPEDMQDLGAAIVSTIDWFGKLCALNVASEIAELVSSVLQILTIAGGAVVNVAGNVVVNGSGAGTGGGGNSGTGGASTAGAGAGEAGSAAAGSARALNGSTVVGSADDVAEALGTSADDVVKTFGEKASYSIDDIANGLGSSADDVVKAYGESIDEVVKAGAQSADDVAKGAGGLFKSLSKTGKTLGVLGTMVQVASTGYEAFSDYSSGDKKGGTEALGGGAGALGGSYGGAVLGTSIAPGLGTVIGAVLGAIGGDKLARDFTGAIYDNYSNAHTNYGTGLAGLPITGGLFQKDGTIAQQKIQKKRDDSDIKPSDYGMPKIFDKNFDPDTGEIYFDSIINTLQKAKDHPLTWGGKEDKYGMNVDEAKKWQNSEEYKSYLKAISDTKDTLINAQEELEAKMLTIKKGDSGYDERLDANKYGYYKVWSGTREELKTYQKDKTYLTDPNEVATGTEREPYMLSDLEQAVKNGIMSGMQQSNNKQDNASKGEKKDGTINLTGDIKIPNIDSIVKKMMPSGYAALSEKGKKDLIQNEVKNDIKIDDSVTMQPKFTVSAPNVNVDVKVDRNDNVTKNVSILNPGQASLLDAWYSRTSSQYGKTQK